MVSNIFDSTTKVKCVFCKELINIEEIINHEKNCDIISQDADFDPTYGVDDNAPAHTNNYDED